MRSGIDPQLLGFASYCLLPSARLPQPLTLRSAPLPSAQWFFPTSYLPSVQSFPFPIYLLQGLRDEKIYEAGGGCDAL
jgi:hypothetical protein